MKPIRFTIRKKTLVPTRRNIAHSHRSDWKKVWVVGYDDSLDFFNIIRTEYQLARVLKEKWGCGVYSIIGWCKGVKGFFSFIKIQCEEEGFIRLPKTKSPEQIMKKDLLYEKRKVEGLMTYSSDETGELDKSLKDIKDNLVLLDEVSPYRYHRCSEWIEGATPVHKYHAYYDNEIPNKPPIDDWESQY